MPGFFDRVLNRIEIKREKLVAFVEEAKLTDAGEYKKAIQDYERELAYWEYWHKLAARILAGDPRAYLDAIGQTNPFLDISNLGSSVEFLARNAHLVQVTLHTNSARVVPSEVKRLLKSGRLSVKQMPKGQYYGLYQDYVCSSVLRIARELLALLPINTVIINATAHLFNSQTGHTREETILSVAISRNVLQKLNIDMLNPSDSMNNFIHRMSFKKTKGFAAVDTLKPSDLTPYDQTTDI